MMMRATWKRLSYFVDITGGDTIKLLFVYNPKAGKARIKYYLADILDVFAEKGYEITVAPTRARGDAEVFAAEISEDYDLLVVSGGDGTLDEAVTGLMSSGKIIPVGYIPAGSTNDFGRSLKLPKSMSKSAMIAVSDHVFCCDIGKFNDGYFVYVAAFGLFTDVTYTTPQKEKNKLGYAAYLLESVKRLSDIKTYKMRISYEGGSYEGEFLAGLISNSNSIGGIKLLSGPHVSLNDGLFEVMLIRRPPSLIELNEALAAVVDRNKKSDYVITFPASNIELSCEGDVSWTLDGEYGGTMQHSEICVIRDALKIKTPE